MCRSAINLTDILTSSIQMISLLNLKIKLRYISVLPLQLHLQSTIYFIRSEKITEKDKMVFLDIQIFTKRKGIGGYRKLLNIILLFSLSCKTTRNRWLGVTWYFNKSLRKTYSVKYTVKFESKQEHKKGNQMFPAPCLIEPMFLKMSHYVALHKFQATYCF